jgi:hypothetical protein
MIPQRKLIEIIGHFLGKESNLRKEGSTCAGSTLLPKKTTAESRRGVGVDPPEPRNLVANYFSMQKRLDIRVKKGL